jgi:hypothetical protein
MMRTVSDEEKVAYTIANGPSLCFGVDDRQTDFLSPGLYDKLALTDHNRSRRDLDNQSKEASTSRHCSAPYTTITPVHARVVSWLPCSYSTLIGVESANSKDKGF